MALSFKPKAAATQPGAPAATTAPHNPNPSPAASATPSGGASWLKKGNAATKAYAEEEAKAQARAEEAKLLWRFYCKPGEDGVITFLDGNLDKDGHLDCPVFSEHSVLVAGDRKNFICTDEDDPTQPCPICAKGDKASFVGVLTVCDHRPHIIQKGANAGKTIVNTRKLFVAKRTTLLLLAKKAAKQGGSLAYCTFDVSRQTDKDAAVGNQFDFTVKYPNAVAFAQAYGLKIEDAQPAIYENELRYRTPEDLIALGVGNAFVGSPGGPASQGASAAVKKEL